MILEIDVRGGTGVMILEIDAFEWRCLELAWQSCRSGTIGVGAVLVGPAGDVLAEGNNAIFAKADAGLLEGSRIAHAEMNVFAQVPPGRLARDAILYTSLEPCAMCAGAILMHDLASVRVLARDPLMHDLEAMGDRNDWVRSRWAPRDFAVDPAVVRFASLFAMHMTFYWFYETHPSVSAMSLADPELALWIRSVAQSTVLAELAAENASLEQVVRALG